MLRCVSSNVQKSRANTHLLLESYADADIICVQEIFWGVLRQIPSARDREGTPYLNTAAHANFICVGASARSRVATYVHKRWAHASPSAHAGVLAHDDALVTTLHFASGDFTVVNIYNDSRTHSAVSFLLERYVHLPAVAILAGDFNLRHPMWDARETDRNGHLRRLQRRACDDAIQLATMELGLHLLNDPQGPPTWVSNNHDARPGVLDLVWVDPAYGPYDPLIVHLHDRGASDHAVLEWRVPVSPDRDSTPRIARDSEAASRYLRDLGEGLSTFPVTFRNRHDVESAADDLRTLLDTTWHRHATVPRRTARSKTWWNETCTLSARLARDSRELAADARRSRRDAFTNADPDDDLIAQLTAAIAAADDGASRATAQLKRDTRAARRQYFSSIVTAADHHRVWDLVQWTKPRKLDSTAAILQPDGNPTQSQHDLRNAFQTQFTPADPHPVDESVLDAIPQLPERPFPPMSLAELEDALASTSNTSAPGPDHLTWFWIKRLLHLYPSSATVLLALFNACVAHGIHPDVFKWSVTVIIPKPNKTDYSRAKAYRPIALLNCLGKLLEKMIARRLQFDGQKHGILHPGQYGGTFQHSTQDAGVQLVHNVRQAWRAGLDTSAVLLDVAQFFPSINHIMLQRILGKQGFHPDLCAYFANYLGGRTTQFLYNGQLMDPVDFTVGVGQGSALSPILSALYIAPVLHHSAQIHHAVHANASLQFFVDDGLISVAAPPIDRTDSAYQRLLTNNAILSHLFHSLAQGLLRLGLHIEPDKLEVMHFTRTSYAAFPSDQPLGPDLALRLRDTVTRVAPQPVMRYLGFFLDPQLTFRPHVRHYVNKACSTVHAFRILGNSVRGLRAPQRRSLYISNILPVALYGAQLWWHPGWVKTAWIARELQKVQARAARWITGCFRTTPGGALDLLARLIPIRPQVNSHMRRAAYRIRTLHANHIIRSSLSPYWRNAVITPAPPFPLLQATPLNPNPSPLHHSDWLARTCTEDFAPLHPECRPGDRLRDVHSGRLHTHLTAPPKASPEFVAWRRDSFTPRLRQANAAADALVLFTDGSHRVDGSEVRTASAWALFHRGQRVRHGAFAYGRATPYDAEMAALARGIRVAIDTCSTAILHLHVFVDNRAAARAILEAKLGPSHLLSVSACSNVRSFLDQDPRRSVSIHWCPAHVRIAQNELVDTLAKDALAFPAPPTVTLAAARQAAKQTAIRAWHALARQPAYHGRSGLLQPLAPSLCTASARNHPILHPGGGPPHHIARLCRVLTGHFPHGAYRQRFRLPGPHACLCGAPLETLDHILHACPLWLRCPSAASHPSIADVRLFLDLNPMVGSFDWTDLLCRAQTDHDAAVHPSLAETTIWMHTTGKLNAIRALDDPDIWTDPAALRLFTALWDAEREANDWCDGPHLTLCPWPDGMDGFRCDVPPRAARGIG